MDELNQNRDETLNRLAPEKKTGIQSVDRALTILEIIAASTGEISLNDICARARLNVSTGHHLVKTLVSRNYVAPGSGRGTYSLGSQVLTLAGAVNWQSNLSGRAQPLLDHLNATTGEAVHLAVLEGVDLVTLIKREARHALRVDAGSIGKTGACHATATGKAILAWLPEDEALKVLEARGMRAFTEKTITDRDRLLQELHQVRTDGFAVDNEEFQQHVVCVGAPILDQNGSVIGSISVSTPTVRANDEHLALVRREVMAATGKLSGRAPETAKN